MQRSHRVEARQHFVCPRARLQGEPRLQLHQLLPPIFQRLHHRALWRAHGAAHPSWGSQGQSLLRHLAAQSAGGSQWPQSAAVDTLMAAISTLISPYESVLEPSLSLCQSLALALPGPSEHSTGMQLRYRTYWPALSP